MCVIPKWTALSSNAVLDSSARTRANERESID
jgi:hypothetical protein